MNTLAAFWPTVTNVAECIRTEAEVLDEAVLLAVHEPSSLIKRSAVDASEVAATEDDLLKELMRDASDGSAVLVPITGDSGVGKSHLVRWLYAQLKRHERRDELVVVLIPKTASLRHVVELILKSRGEEGSYGRLLNELRDTVDALSPSDAAAMLNTALSLVLERNFQEGKAKLTAGARDDQAFRDRVDLTKKLRDLIREPEVFDHWLGQTLERIIRQTLVGGSAEQTGEQRRFEPADLVPPANFTTAASRPAISNILTQLTKADGAYRPLAAEVLQDALDPALREVFKLSQALGQRTIEEIVNDIRVELLKEGRELVLLIEDFAALAGIQQPLLNLMIAESDHAGIRVRAPIRTALAVTDGFLPSRQTILTRARQEWVIPNTLPSRDAIVDRFVSLAGRYLNAARWGAAGLREHFKSADSVQSGAWLRPFPVEMSDEDARKLSAFGQSDAGYPLFPLSRIAIERIVRRELSPGGEPRFNPRHFINRVLRDTLGYRPQFEVGRFPPPEFKGASPTPEVQLALSTLGLPADEVGRMRPVLDFWAGNPASLSVVPLVEMGVFEAFNLSWPFVAADTGVPPRPSFSQPPENRETRTASMALEPAVPPIPAPAFEYVDKWARGVIDQQNARRVRNLLASALKARTDWSPFRLRARAIEAGHLWLPFAPTGNPANAPKFVIGEATNPLDPVLTAGVRALERWSAHGASWDYESAEGDYPVAQMLLERIEKQIIAWHRDTAVAQAAVALKSLHRQALMLGLTNSTRPEEPKTNSYFAEGLKQLWTPEEGDRSAVALSARLVGRVEAARETLCRILVDAVGCFQGDGKNVLAIDPKLLHQAWKTPLPDSASLVLGTQLGAARTAVDDVLDRVDVSLKRLADAIEPTVIRVQEKLTDFLECPPEFSLRSTLDSARLAGLFGHGTVISYDQAVKSINVLSSREARDLIARAQAYERLALDAPIEERLSAWSKFDLATVANLGQCLDNLERLLPMLERALGAEMNNLGGVDVQAMLTELKHDLQALAGEEGR
jgi:hypothetical protein